MEPTVDTSKKLRLQVTFTLQSDFARYRGLIALCGIHDPGASISDTNHHPGLYILNHCSSNPNCNVGGHDFVPAIENCK